MKKITTLIPILTMVGSTTLVVPTVTSCSKNNPTVTTTHIKKLTSDAQVEVTDQNTTTATYTFEANESGLSADNLTALIKTESGQTTNFSIDAKGYVEVEGNVITLTVTFSAADIKTINDECKFDVYFTNADSKDTWAENYAGLSVKYTSPFLNSNLSTKQYVFWGKDAGRRQMSINLVDDSSLTAENISASAKITEGNLKVKEITEIEVEDNVVTLMLPYDSSSISGMETSKCELTLTTNNFSQTFEMSITTVNTVYPVNTEYTVSTGAAYSKYVCELSLPLGANETINDFEKIEITDISTGSTITPVFATTSKAELSAEKDYITFYIKIENAQIVENGFANFSIYLKKTDRSSEGTGYTQGWSKTVSDLKLYYKGAALALTQSEFDFTSQGTISSGTNIEIDVPFSANKLFDISTELPSDITFTTHDVTPKPSGYTYTWENIFKSSLKQWSNKGTTCIYETIWKFNPRGFSSFESGTYTHTIEFIVYWGEGTKYTQQAFYFTIKTNLEAES